MINDLRFALRMLRKNSGFTAVVVLTLAFGIGANTAVFTLINDLLLKRLPVREPERLVALSHADKLDRELDFSYPEYLELRARNDVLASLAATYTLSMTIESENMPAAWVSGDYLNVLGKKPFLGRTISPEDDRLGNAVAMLQYDLWKRRFGGDPTIVGKSVDVLHRPFTVIGVLPPGFYSLDAGRRKTFWFPSPC